MEHDDQDIEKLLETTDWEPKPDPVREQASFARIVALLDRRRRRMRMVARISCAFAVVILVIVTGTIWYRWTRPMVIAFQETQSLPMSVARLVHSTSAETPGIWHVLLAHVTARDPRGLLTSVRSVPGTDLLRAELSGSTGYVLLLPGRGVVGIAAAASESAKITQGFTAVMSGDAPGVTAQDLAAANSVVSNDTTVARVGSPSNDGLEIASVYQPTIPYKNDNHATSYDPFVFSTPSGYIRMRRIVAITLKPQQENQALLTALVDIDGHHVVGIVDTTHISGVILTENPGPQIALTAQ